MASLIRPRVADPVTCMMYSGCGVDDRISPEHQRLYKDTYDRETVSDEFCNGYIPHVLSKRSLDRSWNCCQYNTKHISPIQRITDPKADNVHQGSHLSTRHYNAISISLSPPKLTIPKVQTTTEQVLASTCVACGALRCSWVSLRSSQPTRRVMIVFA